MGRIVWSEIVVEVVFWSRADVSMSLMVHYSRSLARGNESRQGMRCQAKVHVRFGQPQKRAKKIAV